ncbi:helix-turn-helix domain-containing protein [Actinophytocola oryzae]|uniref:helix-turn-helix domain-containing protein n=1 Tax=Actinophytocola oryzae TaxID=502181 RepID=UPI001FBA7058|nr:helix-turn-helix domain-containing protein [Actinophytocola oryzae]
MTAYIRGARLESARRELVERLGRLTVTEVAARWHFADSSRFIRAFWKRYGQSPAEYARSTGQTADF